MLVNWSMSDLAGREVLALQDVPFLQGNPLEVVTFDLSVTDFRL